MIGVRTERTLPGSGRESGARGHTTDSSAVTAKRALNGDAHVIRAFGWHGLVAGDQEAAGKGLAFRQTALPVAARPCRSTAGDAVGAGLAATAASRREVSG